MHSDLLVRPLRVSDLPRYVRLRNRIERASQHKPTISGGHESLFRALFRMLAYRSRIQTFVAIDRGDLVGFITLIFGRSSKFRGNAYISNVSVDEACRGRGVGTQLLHESENYAKSRHARRLELEVFAKNKGAIDLYERLGWQVEGRKRQAVQDEDGFDDLIFMAKFIN